MWVTFSGFVERANSFLTLGFLKGFTHTFSHKVKALNSPLTWGYSVFPQVNGLVTTTTYNYIKTPVRFPMVNFLNARLLKEKTCKVLRQQEG